ncbi:MAG: carboxylating nicotinate-nucleotide diphosphorylase [Candidatus Saccharimonadales bacterium]
MASSSDNEENKRNVEPTLSNDVANLLHAADLDPTEIKLIVKTALEEDLRWGPDVTTSATTGKNATTVAEVVTRKPGVLAGLPVALEVLAEVGLPQDATVMLHSDGEVVAAGVPVLRITGSLRKILRAERTLLNFLTHLSGIATATRSWVDAIDGTGCIVRDTRKTTPGLRSLEKYAVRCGGGTNHRMGLGDAALIKDNHIIAAGGVTAAIKAVRKAAPDIVLEVECDTISQVNEALAAKVKLILLDNMSLGDIRTAVALGHDYPETRFEASGGLRLENARVVAKTGVHFLAVGALTHSSPALDLALDLCD